jgi:CheY-like chemotaxis protein
MIKNLGYEADFAENGDQAVEKYSGAMQANNPFDVVILDLTIRGGMGGKETIKKMVEIHPAVKAIVSSGYSEDDILARYRDYGFMAVLSKPYQIEELGRVLHILIRKDS